MEQLTENVSDSNIEILEEGDIKITTVKVDKQLSKELNKKVGNYITIEFKDITDIDNRENVGKILEQELDKLIKLRGIKENDSCLLIGLGNAKSTADALGPKTIEKSLITRHLFLLNVIKPGMRNVCAINPGVMATTGMETYDIIKGIINEVRPGFVIVIDSLAAYSLDRINKTIQLTDTGILPGSGVGNHRQELSDNTLGIPVIALGVPTVVDASTIVSNTISYITKHISYLKNNPDLNKLIVSRSNYLAKIKNIDLDDNEKQETLGLVGLLTEEDKYNLIKEVLTSVDYNLIVTPKEIDFLIDKLSDLISASINNALHKEISNY